MITDRKSSTGYGTIVMFSDDGNEIINRVHKVRKLFRDIENGYTQELEEILTKEAKALNLLDHIELPINQDDPADHYQVPIPTAKKFDVYDVPKYLFSRPMSDSFLSSQAYLSTNDNLAAQHSKRLTTFPHQSLYQNHPTRLFSWKNMADISESMLDCSLTSNGFPIKRMGSESSSDNSSNEAQSRADFYIGEVGQEVMSEKTEEIYEEIQEVLTRNQPDIKETQTVSKKEIEHKIENIEEVDEEDQENNNCNKDDVKDAIKIKELDRPRSYTVGGGLDTSGNENTLKFAELLTELTAAKLDHKEFMERIKKGLISVEDMNGYGHLANTREKKRSEKRRSSYDYCIMESVNDPKQSDPETKIDDAQYMIMKSV